MNYGNGTRRALLRRWRWNSPFQGLFSVQGWSIYGVGLMKRLLIGTALLLTALPFTFDGVTPTVSKANAVIGRPLTPGSVAGVHRRAMRRHVAFHRPVIRHPVA